MTHPSYKGVLRVNGMVWYSTIQRMGRLGVEDGLVGGHIIFVCLAREERLSLTDE